MFLLCFLTLVALMVEDGVTERGAATVAPVPPQPPTDANVASYDRNISNNQSVASPATNSSTHGTHKTDVGCKGLRSKRYISDGFCRTLKPISEVLCTGFCVPERYQGWYPEFMKVWGKTKVMEYRCVDGVVRHQKINLMCDNGKMRSYKIKVVKSCACRKQLRQPLSSRRQRQQQQQQQQQQEAAAAVAPGSIRTTVARHDRQSKNSKTRQMLSNA